MSPDQEGNGAAHDSGPLLSRRSALITLTGPVATLIWTARIHAQPGISGESFMYFVPGGRIGFNKPQEVDVWTNRWILLSQDHTLMVQVREALRLGADHDSYLWDKDKQKQRVSTSLALDGLEVRRFRDLGYDPSPDYASESVVLRDAHWMGEVQVTTNDQGGLTMLPGGQNARWRKVMDDIQRSIVVRPRPPMAIALAELHVGLDTTGLNPRLVGEEFILSLYRPNNAMEAWGANHPTIRSAGLTLLTPGLPDEHEKVIDELFSIARQTPGSQVIAGAACRGVLQTELQIIPGFFAIKLIAFGRTRLLELSAFYESGNRGPMIDALDRVFQSLTLPDLP